MGSPAHPQHSWDSGMGGRLFLCAQLCGLWASQVFIISHVMRPHLGSQPDGRGKPRTCRELLSLHSALCPPLAQAKQGRHRWVGGCHLLFQGHSQFTIPTSREADALGAGGREPLGPGPREVHSFSLSLGATEALQMALCRRTP